MTSIFRQEKTQRIIGDDLVRGGITDEFWEAQTEQGGVVSLAANAMAISGANASSLLRLGMSSGIVATSVISGAVFLRVFCNTNIGAISNASGTVFLAFLAGAAAICYSVILGGITIGGATGTRRGTIQCLFRAATGHKTRRR